MELMPVTLKGLDVTGPKEEICGLLYSDVLYGLTALELKA